MKVTLDYYFGIFWGKALVKESQKICPLVLSNCCSLKTHYICNWLQISLAQRMLLWPCCVTAIPCLSSLAWQHLTTLTSKLTSFYDIFLLVHK